MANDNEILKQQEEDRRKLMNDFADKMSHVNGKNLSDQFFSVEETPNGLAIGIKGKFDPFHLPDGWQYEPAYLLASGYPQEGFYRMVDGKREFMPIKNIQDRTIVREYRDIIDVRSAISAENPHINTEQIQADPQTGAILLVGVVNDFKVPQGLSLNDSGQTFEQGTDYAKGFEIRKVTAHEYYNSVLAGSKESQTEDMKQQP